MDKYTASNGVVVERDGSMIFTTHGALLPQYVDALREFFQAERDEELGRWRWPEKPEYVVYPSALYSHPANPDRVMVVNEQNGQSHRADRDDPDRLFGFFSEAGRAFFDAHPERKPWHDANRDEVWLFKSEGRGHALAWRAEDGWDVIDQRGNYHKGIDDVPAEMVAHSFYGWENATAVRLLPEAS